MACRSGDWAIIIPMILLLRALMNMAALFLVAAILLLLSGIAGIRIPAQISIVVYSAGLLVFILSFFVMRRLQDGYTQREIREHGWKIALRGAPSWVEKAIKLWSWVTMISFAGLMLLPAPRRDAMFRWIFAPVYLIFFSAWSAGVFYSALHAERYDLKCLNGHTITLSQKFCPQCGAPAAHPAATK